MESTRSRNWAKAASRASMRASMYVCAAAARPGGGPVGGDVQWLGQVVPGSEVEHVGFDADETEGEGHVVAVGQGLLADLAGGAEGEAVMGLGLAAGGAGQVGRGAGPCSAAWQSVTE